MKLAALLHVAALTLAPEALTAEGALSQGTLQQGALTLVQGAPAQEVVAGQGAVLRGLDKIAGTTRDFELRPGEVATFGRLTITLTECRYPAANPAADAFAHLVIRDDRLPEPVFRGWMIASSPALNAVDHPRFDVWLIRCASS